MKGLIAVPVRLFAFLGKELVETIRRPGALFSLVLGPFLIMAIFGLGYDGYRNPLRTVVVAPPETGLPQNPSDYAEIAGDALMVTEVTADRAQAEEQLANQQVEVRDRRTRGRRGALPRTASSRSSTSRSTSSTRSRQRTRRSSCSCWRPR